MERGHNLCLSEEMNLSSVFEFTRLEEFHTGKSSPKPIYTEGFAQFQAFASLVQFCIYNLPSLAVEAAPPAPVHRELGLYHCGWDMVQTNLTSTSQPRVPGAAAKIKPAPTHYFGFTGKSHTALSSLMHGPSQTPLNAQIFQETSDVPLLLVQQ